ncbi:hypothetical protein PENSPDRAFT_250053 [Peniophora sp. CONT]|nr:hypothetical protein PENSPDRAFT_250053 [Peniophora sp. CONT]
MHIAPRGRRGDWSPTSSRLRPGSPYAASANGEGPSSRPMARNTGSPGPSRYEQSHRSPSRPKTHSPSPAEHLSSAAPFALSDPPSISSAIQSLSKLVKQENTTVAEPSPPPQPPAQTVDAPVKKESDPDPPDADVGTLRSQLEQSSAQRDLQRKRIRELQHELSTEREARAKAETLLEEERQLLEAERRKLGDMRQECSTPFLVPVLLDAFLKVGTMAHESDET